MTNVDAESTTRQRHTEQYHIWLSDGKAYNTNRPPTTEIRASIGDTILACWKVDDDLGVRLSDGGLRIIDPTLVNDYLLFSCDEYDRQPEEPVSIGIGRASPDQTGKIGVTVKQIPHSPLYAGHYDIVRDANIGPEESIWAYVNHPSIIEITSPNDPNKLSNKF